MTRYAVTMLVAELLVAASHLLSMRESTHELMAFKKKKP